MIFENLSKIRIPFYYIVEFPAWDRISKENEEKKRITILHYQKAVPGLANRYAAKFEQLGIRKDIGPKKPSVLGFESLRVSNFQIHYGVP